MPAQLDQTFIMTLSNLIQNGEDAYQQHKTGFGGSWSLPFMGNSSWQGDLFDFTLMGDAFNRSDLDEQYVTAINNSILDDSDIEEPSVDRGTIADIAGVKMQTGCLEQREQAFRARHTTPIMATCYAAARRKGHGASGESMSGVFGVMIDHVVNTLNHGR